MRNIVLTFIIISLSGLNAATIGKVDTASKAMAAAAHPLAVETGIDILNQGGNAVDAAVSMAFVIGVVEPYASGLGGGGGMLIFQKDKNRLHYLDYYMETSARADSNYSDDELHTSRSICIPGTPAGLITAAEQFGSLPLQTIIQPAIDIAKAGIVVNQKFYGILLDQLDVLMNHPATRDLYFKNDFPAQPGDTLYNPQLIAVLQGLAHNGQDYFYKGAFARQAAKDIQADGGYLSYDDFARYEAQLKEPPRIQYRDLNIYSAAPPQSGTALLEILNIYELADFIEYESFDRDALPIHLMTEAILRADVDRYHYLGDPRYFDVPVKELTGEQYARVRFADIIPERRYYSDSQGIPVGKPYQLYSHGEMADSVYGGMDRPHTTHISVIDEQGNAVSLTQTLGLFFGSGFSSQGIIFNSSMSNFYHRPSPNHLGPQRRPLSTICPTMVFKNDEMRLVMGTPGGGRIFNVMAQMIVRMFDFNQDPVTATHAPRFSIRSFNHQISYENLYAPEIIDQLKKYGYEMKAYDGLDKHFGGVQLIFYDKQLNRYIGVSDPRRTGGAMGID